MQNVQTDTLQIDQVSVTGGGVIGMCACPGRNQPGTHDGVSWQRDLQEDLSSILRWKADYLVTLVETAEFETLGVPDFTGRVNEAGMGWLHLPTKNLCAPDFSSCGTSPALDHFLDAELRKGKRIVIHCAAGKGRTGTLASALLIRQNRSANAAVAEIRKARPGTIESAAQLEFLQEYAKAISRPEQQSRKFS